MTRQEELVYAAAFAQATLVSKPFPHWYAMRAVSLLRAHLEQSKVDATSLADQGEAAMLVEFCSETPCQAMRVKAAAMRVKAAAMRVKAAAMRVKAAAIRADDGLIYKVARPGRHHDAIRSARGHGYGGPVGEQGFVLDDNSFVDRHEALVYAIKAGQLLDRAPAAGHWKHGLFSEDVW